MTVGTRAVEPARRRGTGGHEILGFALAGAVILGVLWLMSGNDARALRRGPTGFDGLVHWLKSEGVEARNFTGGGLLRRGEVGLRILPLFDTNLTSARRLPTTEEEVIAQTSERDISLPIVRAKLRDLPTLVVLPKWRAGMRLLGVAHQSLLIPPANVNRVARQLGLKGTRIRRDPGGLGTRPADGGRLELMHGQVLAASGCTPVIGTAKALILGKCRILGPSDDTGAQEHFWVLADPDLMNNHGLILSGNADIATALVRRFDLGKPVLIDLTDTDQTVPAEWFREQHERSWEDLARLFRWPFAMIWIAFCAVALLIFWRAVIRDGPLAAAGGEHPRAAKEVSIEAKARLLRLADHDAALLTEHVAARLAHLAARLLGPHRKAGGSPLANLERLVGRRDPALAAELRAVAVVPTGLDGPSLLRHLDRFETCYAKVTHEFGRTTDAG